MIDRSTLRIAIRTLGRHKGFTIVAVLSIAIAIALNTTLYSVLEAMLAPRINARRPDQVYGVYYFGDRFNRLGPNDVANAVAARMKSFDGLSGSRVWARWRAEPLVENGRRYMRAMPMEVRTNFFDFLGTQPMEGRTFLARDEGERHAVISDRVARKLFPDESPIGRSILLDDEGYTVVGVVARQTTFFPLSADLWIPRHPSQPPIGISLMRFTEPIIPQAVGDLLKDVAAQLALAAGEQPGETAFRARWTLARGYTLRRFHWALIGAVGAVLLVACANLANLQLARGLARTRELALRSAVGASRRQLVHHLLVETGLVAALGLLLGVALTLWGLYVTRALVPPAVEDILIQPQASWRMFVVAAAVALLCLFLVGLLPALHISRVDPDALLKSGNGTGANRPHRRRYGVMVLMQVGLALPVLIGAVVLAKAAVTMHSSQWLVREVYGYDPSPVVAVNIPLVAPVGREVRIPVKELEAELTARARSVPGILDAAFYMRRGPEGKMIMIDDETGELREAMAHLWSYSIVSPSYLRTLGRSIERGRDFMPGEFDGQAVLMDAPTARFLWGGHPPLGRAIRFGDRTSRAPFLRVAGIVGDLRDTFAIRRRDYTSNYRLNQVFRVVSLSDTLVVAPPAQRMGRDGPVVQRPGRADVTVYARSSGNSELAALRLQRALRSFRSGSEAPTAVPLLDQFGISQTRIRQDFVASLFGAFALLGVALSALGVYGIVSHSVTERRRELAVRISLGATLRDILHSVLREGNAIILGGIALGLAFTYYTVGWLGQFYITEYDGNDAILFAVIAAVLFTTAVVAALVPALRAWRIDPVEALRHE